MGYIPEKCLPIGLQGFEKYARNYNQTISFGGQTKTEQKSDQGLAGLAVPSC